jgi:hypothetical protein
MNEEELHALLRAADACALRAAREAIDIEDALFSAKEAELDMLLREADASALHDARERIDVSKELIAAKAAAASQLVTDQATGEAPPATVFRSLLHIVDVSGAVTVTTSEARRRARNKIIMGIGTFGALASVGIGVLVLHQSPALQIPARSSITTAAAGITGAVLGLATMELVHGWRLYRTMERRAWQMAGRMAKTCCGGPLGSRGRTGYKAAAGSGGSNQTIVALALPEWNDEQNDGDTDKRTTEEDLTDSLESTSER